MAAWKPLVYSGSSATLASLTLDTALGVAYGGTGMTSIGANNFPVGSGGTAYTTIGSNGTGTVVRSSGATNVIMSGAFSGSYIGDGSGLTNITATTVFSIYGDNGTSGSFNANTDNIKFATASNHGFNFSVTDATQFLVTLNTPQDLKTTAKPVFSAVTASTMQLTGLSAGSTNTVLQLDAVNGVATRTIDARVWGSTLIDGVGANTRVAFYTDADTISSNAAFTYDGTALTVGTSTFGTNTVIAGDLTVMGTTYNMEITNLNVEDRFILMNSGSASGDGGIIIQTETDYSGSAFGWYDSTARFAMQISTKLGSTATSIVPDAYVAAVIDVDGGMTDVVAHQKVGNIRISGSAAYIWI